MDVVEQLTIRFTGQWNGLNRDLSLQHNTAQGRRTKLDVEDGSITDASGQPLRVEYQTIGNGWTRRYHIYIPGAADADRVITVRYRVRNAIRFFDAKKSEPAFDELYWNVTGNEWTMRIDSVHGRVVLPTDVRPTRVAIYTGPAGETGAAARTVLDENEVAFTSTQGLYPNEGLTIGVGWPTGHIAGRPSRSHEQLLAFIQWTPLIIPLLVFWFAYHQWDKKGRDPKEGSYVVRYEPVAGMSPAELGTLVDNKADMADITATLVDLAVRGYVHIEEIETSRLLGLAKSVDYILRLTRDPSQWKELKLHEQHYLGALARLAPIGESEVKISELTNKFYTALPSIRDAIYDALVGAGYYRERPDKTLGKWISLTLAVVAAQAVLAVIEVKTGIDLFSLVAVVTAAVLSFFILLGFALIMPARTVDGARVREAALGFKEFLSRVEEDRYKRMITSPALFEQYLPFAMAFGVADRWANAFRDMYLEPPQWYSGGSGPFNAMSFSNSISNMSRAAASTMSSSPSSSGSGGGGSSGGGSGGGGGSGF